MDPGVWERARKERASERRASRAVSGRVRRRERATTTARARPLHASGNDGIATALQIDAAAPASQDLAVLQNSLCARSVNVHPGRAAFMDPKMEKVHGLFRSRFSQGPRAPEPGARACSRAQPRTHLHSAMTGSAPPVNWTSAHLHPEISQPFTVPRVPGPEK